MHEMESRQVSRRDARVGASAARKKRRTRTAIVLVITVLVFGGALMAVSKFAKPLTDVLAGAPDYDGPGTGSVTVTVAKGDTGAAIGKTLHEADVVKSADAFVAAAKSSGAGDKIQPGSYTLLKQIPASKAVDMLLDPKSKSTDDNIQILEGKWTSEIFAQLAQKTGRPVAEFQAAAQDPAVGLPPEARGNPEGYLFPNTYHFEPDATPVDMLKTMVAEHKKVMAELNVPVDRQRDVLIKASIIQAEGRLPEDLPKIGRVIENRLGINMALQMDSTIAYMHQKRVIDTTDKERKAESPLNTYAHPGLPDAPICHPGKVAIQAALNPTPGKWLYFVAVNTITGETKFAESFAEHQKHEAEWKRWARENGRAG